MRVLWLLPVVLAADCEETSLLRLPGWTSGRDLAYVAPAEALNLTDALRLNVLGVVPSFGKEAYITLLHNKARLSIERSKKRPLRRQDQQLWKWFRWNKLYCSGPNRSHLAELAVVHTPFTLNLLCPWPSQESSLGNYEVFLEDAAGKAEMSIQQFVDMPRMNSPSMR